MKTDVKIRMLNSSDAVDLRAIRLEALNNEGRFFTADKSVEAARKLSDWESLAQETFEQAICGAFIGTNLIGIMAVEKWKGDLTGRTAKFHSTYIKLPYRQSDVAAKLYKMRETWTIESGFEQAVFTIHPENYLSARIHIENGAKGFSSEPMRFADGSIATAIWYRKSLQEMQLIAA